MILRVSVRSSKSLDRYRYVFVPPQGANFIFLCQKGQHPSVLLRMDPFGFASVCRGTRAEDGRGRAYGMQIYNIGDPRTTVLLPILMVRMWYGTLLDVDNIGSGCIAVDGRISGSRWRTDCPGLLLRDGRTGCLLSRPLLLHLCECGSTSRPKIGIFLFSLMFRTLPVRSYLGTCAIRFINSFCGISLVTPVEKRHYPTIA